MFVGYKEILSFSHVSAREDVRALVCIHVQGVHKKYVYIDRRVKARKTGVSLRACKRRPFTTSVFAFVLSAA